jgi:hypothetical protein
MLALYVFCTETPLRRVLHPKSTQQGTCKWLEICLWSLCLAHLILLDNLSMHLKPDTSLSYSPIGVNYLLPFWYDSQHTRLPESDHRLNLSESRRLHGIATHCNTLQAKTTTIRLLKKACKITNTLYKSRLTQINASERAAATAETPRARSRCR